MADQLGRNTRPEDEAIEVRLTPSEAALLRTALEMLEDTFGHEEAEELAEVQALLAKLRRLEAGDRAGA